MVYKCIRFLKIYFIDYAVTVVPTFFYLFSFLPSTPPSIQQLPPRFMSMGHAYKFFGFSISYILPNLPLCILYLSVMLRNPCACSPIFALLLPTDNGPYDLHFCDSVPVLVVCLVWLCFRFLDSVVDSCHFVVILLFIVLIFFFLNKSL